MTVQLKSEVVEKTDPTETIKVYRTKVIAVNASPEYGAGAQKITFGDFDKYMHLIRTIDRVVFWSQSGRESNKQ